MDSIRLQATIGSFGAGGAACVLGEVDIVTGVLLIDAQRSVRPGEPERRHDGCAAVTNNPAADDVDSVFTEEDLRDAISDYYDTVGRGLLALDPSCAMLNPESKIEPDGLDERGRKYRIAQDMTNSQVAVLVLCWFARRQSAVVAQVAAFDDFTDLAVTTVGMPGGGAVRRPGVASYAMGGAIAMGHDGWPV